MVKHDTQALLDEYRWLRKVAWRAFISHMTSIGNDPDEFTKQQLRDMYDEWLKGFNDADPV